MQLYAQLFSVSLGFYQRRDNLNPVWSAICLVSLWPALMITSGILALQRTGTIGGDEASGERYVLATVAVLLLGNWLVLRSSTRRDRLLASVSDPRCVAAKVFIVLSGVAVVLSLVFSKGWLLPT